MLITHTPLSKGLFSVQSWAVPLLARGYVRYGVHIPSWPTIFFLFTHPPLLIWYFFWVSRHDNVERSPLSSSSNMGFSSR